MSYRPVDWQERVTSKIEVRDLGECWPWAGWRRKDGYGLIRFYESPVAAGFHDERATRLLWEIVHGVPPTDFICHTCDWPPCMNPLHHFEGTPADNQIDKMLKGRYANGNSVKTHCLRGHSLSGDNLHIQKDGRRNCKECARVYWRTVYYPKWRKTHGIV